MKELFTIELTHEEWVEIMVAMNQLKYSRNIVEQDKEKADLDKEITENIQNQLSMHIEKNTK